MSQGYPKAAKKATGHKEDHKSPLLVAGTPLLRYSETTWLSPTREGRRGFLHEILKEAMTMG
jgi:hypothetical protein